MFRLRFFTCIIFMASVSVASAQHAKPDPAAKARLGRTLWSAFTCGMFAGMSDNEKEQRRLFELGLKAGREFIKALENGDIPAEVSKKEVPVGVLWNLEGPSADFIIGRIYQDATKYALDKLKDEKGNYLLDDSIKKMRAQNEYLAGNCSLVR
jgi:hypothetical protein